MSALISKEEISYGWVQKELSLSETKRRGNKDIEVKRIQEWLCYHKFKTGVDYDFGPATEKQVKNFQNEHSLEETGEVDEATYDLLVKPLLSTLSPINEKWNSFEAAVEGYARKHLEQSPIEIGGQNMGPWVRLYMFGCEGRDFPWCAGFVTFILKQASDEMNVQMPIQGSISCDTLAAQAKEKGLFVSENDVNSGRIRKESLSPLVIFLYRRTETDWTHTGFALSFENEVFGTIEGNTNDEGHREGYEACQRIRSYGSKDFIRLSYKS